MGVSSGAVDLQPRTVSPDDTSPEALATVYSFLQAHTRRAGSPPRPTYALVGVDEHDRIELPESIHQILVQIVGAMKAGKAVTVRPESMVLTTQQAADLLGVSRPTVVRLIDTDVMPARKVGNRHRLLLDDVLAYRERRRVQQHEAIAATNVHVDADDSPDAIRAELKKARKAIAGRRR